MEKRNPRSFKKSPARPIRVPGLDKATSSLQGNPLLKKVVAQGLGLKLKT